MKPLAKIGPYTLVRRLAVGGMAEIYLAKVAGLAGFEKRLVLKVLHAKYAQDPEFIEMLIQEAKLVVRLSHVNIAQVFDLGMQDDRYYIAMEYVEGLDLYQLLRRCRETKTYLPFDVTCHIIAEICGGLGYAHDRRDEEGRPLDIIHRDISPQNVLVSYDGEVKIIDFGIAKARARSTTTGEGIIKGKFFYMSPEQARGEPLDHRSDLFAVGILCYELLTNRMMYDTDSSRDALRMARAATFLPPSSLRNDLPPTIEEIVLKALSRDREMRYSSAHLMRADITSWLRRHSPGFGRHRLAEYLKQLVESPRQPDLPAMGRADFLVRPTQSVIYRTSKEGRAAEVEPLTPPEGSRKLSAGRRISQAAAAPDRGREPFQADAFDTRPRERLQEMAGVEPAGLPSVQEEKTADLYRVQTALAPTPPPSIPDQSASTPEPAPSALRAALAAWRESVPQDSAVSGVSPDSRVSPRQVPGFQEVEPAQPVAGMGSDRSGRAPWPGGSGQEASQEMSDQDRQRIRDAVSAGLGLGPPEAQGQVSTQEIPPDIIHSMAQQEKDRYLAERGVRSPARGGRQPQASWPSIRPSDAGGPGQPWAPIPQAPPPEDWEPTVDMAEVAATLKDPVQPGGSPPPPQPPAPLARPAQVPSDLDLLDTATEVQVEPGALPRPRPLRIQPVERKVSRAQVIALVTIAILAVTAFVVLLVLAVGRQAPPLPPTGNLWVITTPVEGAQVFLDGFPTDLTTPALLAELPADEPHEVRVWLPGYLEAFATDLTLSPGEWRQVELELLPVGYTAIVESAPPGAEILINNQVVGRTPFELTNINLEGKDGIRVMLRLPGYRPDLFTVRWPAGEVTVRQHRVLAPMQR
ncbi:MAG: protein kinase [Bradymonadales bacterium]|nr:protein kinase [Bradymonadales bacterium]